MYLSSTTRPPNHCMKCRRFRPGLPAGDRRRTPLSSVWRVCRSQDVVLYEERRRDNHGGRGEPSPGRTCDHRRHLPGGAPGGGLIRYYREQAGPDQQERHPHDREAGLSSMLLGEVLEPFRE